MSLEPLQVFCFACGRPLPKVSVTNGPGVVLESFDGRLATPADSCAVCPPPCNRRTCWRAKVVTDEVLRQAA